MKFKVHIEDMTENLNNIPPKNRRAYPHGRARSYANNKFSL